MGRHQNIQERRRVVDANTYDSPVLVPDCGDDGFFVPRGIPQCPGPNTRWYVHGDARLSGNDDGGTVDYDEGCETIGGKSDVPL